MSNAMCNLFIQNLTIRGNREWGMGNGEWGIFRLACHMALLKKYTHNKIDNPSFQLNK